jgi:MSHA biogenesis protein MshO
MLLPLHVSTKHNAKGFTLVELITVIIVLGVVSVGISGFIRTGVDIYSDVTERDQLLGESRFVIERLNRELRMAIPNSVRVDQNNSGNIQCIEFVPSQWVSFYTSLSVVPNTSTSATILEFANNPVGFQLAAGDFGIVYPTDNDDIYDLSEEKRHLISACSDAGDGDCSTADDPGGTAVLTVAAPFAEHSPAGRLYIARQSVSYCANSSGQIYRVQDNITTTQTIYTSGTLMAENLHNDFSNINELPFSVYVATLSRNSLVHILLAFEYNEEIINYSTEVHIPNAP